ncbi:MAG TPA: hypothetical protein VJX70_04920 [Candidatus Acidoferrum sp.]|nr:hypothetical protein [Candidatus Acidoferrum sp.]
MRLGFQFVLALAVAGLASTCAYSKGEDRVAHGPIQGVVDDCASSSSPNPAVPQTRALGSQRNVTRFTTRFDGDHSLDTATVTEQVFARYTLYIVHLQFASGIEQLIAVSAPPGGLQPEMRDMSGDSIPNDLVMTSKLFRSLLVVLVNDGHDHLTVAVSPHPFASGDGQALGSGQIHRIVALASSGVRSVDLADSGELLPQQTPAKPLSLIGQLRATRAAYSSGPGRAPPSRTREINSN